MRLWVRESPRGELSHRASRMSSCCRELELFQLRDKIEAFIPNFASTVLGQRSARSAGEFSASSAGLIMMLAFHESPRPVLLCAENPAPQISTRQASITVTRNEVRERPWTDAHSTNDDDVVYWYSFSNLYTAVDTPA